MSFPPVSELVPQKPPMLLLDRVVTFEEQRITCGATPLAASIFAERGRIPAVVSLEYMAQAVAAYVGLTKRSRGEPPRIGYIIGARTLELAGEHLPMTEELLVHAELSWTDNGTAKFDCRVMREARRLASAELTVFEPPEGAEP